MENLVCQSCESGHAHRYQIFLFSDFGDDPQEQQHILCVKCAREMRRSPQNSHDHTAGITRSEMIAQLDNFFTSSGVFEICARCHEQGTGCCPPTCRVMGSRGCDPANKHGKTVFCAAFICSALMNAISECDPQIGRALKWIKKEVGPVEFHIYEMITRVPADAREPVRPLTLPRHYPKPSELEEGNNIRENLLGLADEVLEIRRAWREKEILE